MATLDSVTIKALGTSSRQQILKMLAKRPYTATELSRMLGRHVTTVAEHLEMLEKSGLVQRKEGSKWVYYTLTQKGENILKPNYSWVVLFSSFLSLIAGGFLYSLPPAAPGAQLASEAAKTALPAAAPAAGTTSFVGLILMLLAVAGFAYLAARYYRMYRNRLDKFN